MKTRLAATVYQILFTAGLLWLMVAAVYGGVTGAGNLLIFLGWTLAILTTFGMFLEVKPPTAPKSYLPRFYGRAVGVIVVTCLLWNGWWFTAFAWAWVWILAVAHTALQREKFPEAT